MFIVSSALEEKDKDKKIDEAKAMLVKAGAKILHETLWGKRKLTFPIKKEKHGYFVVLNFETEPATLGDIKGRLKFMESILRFMIIKEPFMKDAAKKALIPKTEQEIASEKAEKAEAEAKPKPSEVVPAAEPPHKEEAAPTPAKKEKKEKKEKPVALEDLDKKLDEILEDDMNV